MDLITALSTPSVWTALGLIMFTNILLSGDNAVVIAMASRNLAPHHQKRAIFWGSAAAVQLLSLPFLKIIGGILLMKGLVDEALLTEISGGVMTLTGAIWSIINKKEA